VRAGLLLFVSDFFAVSERLARKIFVEEDGKEPLPPQPPELSSRIGLNLDSFSHKMEKRRKNRESGF
jgi:hypothetical protein